jgi:hypothetical protein
MRSGNIPRVIKAGESIVGGTQEYLYIHDGPLETKSESLAREGRRSSDLLIYRVDHLVDLPWARSVEDLWELQIFTLRSFLYGTSFEASRSSGGHECFFLWSLLHM